MSGKKKGPRPGIVAYVNAVKALKGASTSAPVPSIGVTELGEGTLNIVDPAGNDFGGVYVETDATKTNWAENWIVDDPAGFFQGAASTTHSNNFDVYQLDAAKPDFAAIKASLVGTGVYHAGMSFVYMVEPTATAIAQVKPVPPSWTARVYDVRTVKSGSDTITGGLFRTITPGGSWTEHWRLLPPYVRPTGGDLAAGGTLLRVVDKNIASPSLKTFLQAFQGQGGEYVQVTFTWAVL